MTRPKSSSRFPLCVKPLHFNHHLSCSTVYFSGSFSYFEPGTPSSSVRTVKERTKVLAGGIISLSALTEIANVCLSHGRGFKFVTPSVCSAIIEL